MKWDSHTGLQALNPPSSISFKSTPPWLFIINSIHGHSVFHPYRPMSISTPLWVSRHNTPFHKVATLKVSEKHRSLLLPPPPRIKRRWDSLIRVKINLIQLGNRVHSWEITQKKERPALYPPCQMADTCLCLYHQCNAHTPRLWLSTQLSKHCRHSQLSEDLISSFIRSAECHLQKTAWRGRRWGVAAESAWVALNDTFSTCAIGWECQSPRKAAKLCCLEGSSSWATCLSQEPALPGPSLEGKSLCSWWDPSE